MINYKCSSCGTNRNLRTIKFTHTFTLQLNSYDKPATIDEVLNKKHAIMFSEVKLRESIGTQEEVNYI